MSKKRKRQPSVRPNRYNLPMIRDFLDHLLWDARIRQHEHLHPRSKANPELVDQLKKYAERYKCLGFLLPEALHDDVGDDDLMRQADEKLRQHLREVSKERMEKLEAAREIINDALDSAKLQYASKNPAELVNKVDASWILGVPDNRPKPQLPDGLPPVLCLSETTRDGVKDDVRAADVVLGIDIATGKATPFYGREHLERMTKGEDEGYGGDPIAFWVDWDSDEPEILAALCLSIKGSHCLDNSD